MKSEHEDVDTEAALTEYYSFIHTGLRKPSAGQTAGHSYVDCAVDGR